jgi:hypothetical protein
MKHSWLSAIAKQQLSLIFVISLMAVTSVSSAVEKTQTKDSPQAKSTATRPAILYKAPLLDAPEPDTVQSNRRIKDKDSILQTLAPDHTGLTLQSQPTLYLYASKPTAVRFSIAAIKKNGVDPLLTVDLTKGSRIQQLELAEHGVSLQPEVSYQWTVTQLLEKGDQSTAAIASGMIQRIKPGEGLSSRIKKSQGTKLVKVYAIEGIWYDALDTISSMIAKSPDDQNLVAIRNSLLEQVGLHIAAEN